MNGVLLKKKKTEYFDIYADMAYERLGKGIIEYIKKGCMADCTPVILCIGTDRATGDCLGPLVGEQLCDYHTRYRVYGTLCDPVHALNLCEVINDIRREHRNPYIIAVDASLGVSTHVGYVTLSDSPISPGKGVNKKLPAIGDISITGIVNISGQKPSILQNTRLYTVVQLANCIADSIKYAIDYLDAF